MVCAHSVLHTEVLLTYGDHPRSAGLTNRIPARETVAGVAALRCPISNISLIEGVRGTRSLLARVRTWGGGGVWSTPCILRRV